MIKEVIDKVENEEVDKMHEAWLRDDEPDARHEAEPEPVSWEDATEDLDDLPQRGDNHDLEIELES